jgi:hypothetical protein
MLLVLQVKNLLKNRTTYEMIRNQSSDSSEIKDLLRKYNSKVTLRNCKVMCSDNSSSFTTLTNTTHEDIITHPS